VLPLPLEASRYQPSSSPWSRSAGASLMEKAYRPVEGTTVESFVGERRGIVLHHPLRRGLPGGWAQAAGDACFRTLPTCRTTSMDVRQLCQDRSNTAKRSLGQPY
jgi:hypothetical protein